VDNSYPSPDQVLENLGDKVVDGLGTAITGARDDLAEYRAAVPHFVADHSSRGLAGWIHDRMWARAIGLLEDVDDISFVDSEPTREIYVRADYRIRMKRHSRTGAIRSYPTQGALAFINQEPDLLSLLGITTLNITVGYEWDDLTRSMGDPVMSLRDGSFDDVIWMVGLPFTADGGTGTIAPIVPTVPDGTGPATPSIDVPRYDTTSREGTQDE
jgi:hypothetical protein